MKRILICCLAMSLCIGIKAQHTYTLEDCRRLALQNNLNVQTARLEVQGAKEKSREAFTKYFPTISGTATGFKSDKGAVNISSMELQLSATYADRGLLAGVTAVQPVFAGGQIVNGNKLAKVNQEAKSEQLAQSENDAVLNVEQYYWQYISLKEKLKTLNMAEEQVNTILRDVKAAVVAGVSMRNDQLHVELQKNKIAASRLKLNNGLFVTKMLLAQSMEVPADSFEIAEVQLTEVPSPETCRVNHQEALQNNISYKLLEKNVEATRLKRNIEVGKRMPTLGIGAGYMYYNIPDKNTMKMMDDSRSMGMVFASVVVPISDWWGGTHAIRQKKVDLKIAEYSKQSNGELLLVQMQQLWSELEEAYSQVNIAKESVAKAEENLRICTDSYRAGTVALSDWLDAQTLLQQSRDQYTESITDYQIKRTRYLQVTGRG